MDTEEAALYKTLILAVSSICGILLFSAFITVRRHAMYHRFYKKEIDHALNKLESERARIAADIHDDLGPLLSATKISLAAITTGNEGDRVQVEKCIQYVTDTSQKLRDTAQGLMPAVLIRKGLLQAIDQFVHEFNLKDGLAIEFKTGELPPINQNASIHIYRIVQEIVHNCIKHAHASRLVIDFRMNHKTLSICTADNGKGFNEKEARNNSGGYGLINLQSRTHLLNGRLSIASAAGRGTRYVIEIPLSSLQEENNGLM